MIAAFIHITYVISLIIYINKIFLEANAYWDDEGVRHSPPTDKKWLCIIGTCLIYPLVYDVTQAFK